MTRRFNLDDTSLIPHGGHARFVEEVVELGDGEIVCIGRIPAESPFAPDGVAPGFVLLELAAQAAAIEVVARVQGDGPWSRIGFVARAHGLNWTSTGVPANAPLRTRVLRQESLPPLYRYRASVNCDGVEVFRGDFSIYIDFEAS